MNQLQMLKKAMIAYVANSAKAVWSVIAHPLSIFGKKNCDVAGYRIYGNSIQDGTPTPETPIEVQSVGELTSKNLFGYIKGQVANGTIIEELPTGAIVEGKLNPSGGINAYSRGWFRPGNSGTTALCPVLRAGDVVTVSADFTLLELRTEENYRPNIYIGTREGGGGYAPSSYITISVNETKRLSRTFTIDSKDDGKTCYPIFTLNSNIVKIENIQFEIGEELTEYEPYHKYKIPVTVRGKNLCPNDWEVGSISTTGANTSSSSYVRTKDYFALDSLKTYYLSCDDIGMKGEENQATITWFFYDENKSFISRTVSYKNRTISGAIDAGIDIPAGTAFYRLCVQTPNPDIRVQIEEGASATEYEPYIEPQTVNIFADEPLRKVGDYADCVDFGKGVVLRNVGKRIFTGEENMQELGLSNTSYLYRYAMGVTETANLYSDSILMSNYFATGNYLDIRDNPSPAVGILSVSRITFSSTIATLSEFKAWIAELYGSNPLYVCYPLSTPIEEPIILPKLPQFKGTTVYEVQADIPPSGVEVCYYN